MTGAEPTANDAHDHPGSSASTTPAGVSALGRDVYALDTRLSGHDRITSAYLIAGPSPCLVETGTATSAATVEAALRSLGLGADDLATIVVTHIHLDHAGGTGTLARAFPRAAVAVHRAGARHLVDPRRLMASTRTVFSPEVMEHVIGDLIPTDSARVVPLDDGDTVDLGGGRRLSAVDSPGHAKHHLGLLDSVSGDLYVGDAAGLWFADTGEVRPATPPPEFDLAAAVRSLERFGHVEPTRLLFSHFGPAPDPGPTLDRAAEELRQWVSEVAALRDRFGPTADAGQLDHVVAAVAARDQTRYQALAAHPSYAAQIDVLSSPLANVRGVWGWLDRTATDAV